MRRLPITILALLITIALGGVGVVYALWSETLVINGQVLTGSVDVELSIESATTELNPCLPGAEPETPVHDNEGPLCPNSKEVGECTAVLSTDKNSIDFKITKAYPSYECHLDYDIHMVGTVPVKLHPPVLTRTNAPATEVEIKLLGENPVTGADIPNCYPDHHQFDRPSEKVFCELEVHILQPAKMGHTYTFKVEHTAHQYNEHP